MFKKSDSETGVGIKIPCGKCPGCKLEQSRQWAVRCMHEKRLHSDSAFLTLTYSDEHLPRSNSLVLEHLQGFMKRLRSDVFYKTEKTGLRFFACGEYGSKTNRPHYHLLLLNTDFADKKLIKSGSAYNLYASATVSKLWTLGHHALGDVTFDSAAYVARYCLKKNQNGKKVTDGRLPEFVTMSRRPGLGDGYFDRYKDELISHDTIIVNGVSAALPRFYDGKIEKILAEKTTTGLYTAWEKRKIGRRRKNPINKADTTSRRLRDREVVMQAKLKLKGQEL